MPKLENINSLLLLKILHRKIRTVSICSGTACRMGGCLPIAQALQKEIGKNGLTGKVHFHTTGCHGFCEQGPLMHIEPDNLFYAKIQAEDVSEIVEKTLKDKQVISRLLYRDSVSGYPIAKRDNIVFYKAQDRVLLGDIPHIDPKDIQSFITMGGYGALAKVLQSMTPEEVIQEIKDSGLRGRGGGGYPTGRKWEQCRNAPGDEHYVICNANESDPGAYMARTLLESTPHSILEGMLIGAYAIGSTQGFVYVAREYPLALEHLNIAVRQAREWGLLGESILGTPFSFDLQVVRGGGAFICGESSALMATLEGKVGEPRPKEIHSVERGYKNQPTNLNNVETWAHIPKIIQEGAAWFASKGTETSKGTKIFALNGQVRETGLVEVPMDTTIDDIVLYIGGGAKEGRRIKAVQTGGPSGGCLPVSKFELPVDYDALKEMGTMVGSGGIVVMDDTSCMVDVAKYYLNFLQEESCGKCVPCRVGVGRMLEIVTDISEGRGRLEQLELLQELAWTITNGSLCAYGKLAPNPVLSSLKYFMEEYRAHIEQKRCPAKVCRALIHLTIDPEICDNCGKCIRDCPYDAITGNKEEGYTIHDNVCERCGICLESCDRQAIIKE